MWLGPELSLLVLFLMMADVLSLQKSLRLMDVAVGIGLNATA